MGNLVYVRYKKEDLELNGLQMYDCGTKDSYCTYLLVKVDTIQQNYSNKQQASVIFKANAKRLGPLKFNMNDICNIKDVTDVKDT